MHWRSSNQARPGDRQLKAALFMMLRKVCAMRGKLALPRLTLPFLAFEYHCKVTIKAMSSCLAKCCAAALCLCLCMYDNLLLVVDWRCSLHDAGMGVTRWTKALADLQGLGCSLNRPNLEALFRSAVHAPVRCKHLLP